MLLSGYGSLHLLPATLLRTLVVMFVAVVSVPLVLSVYDGKLSDAVSSSNSSTKRSVLSSRHYLPGRTTRTQVTYPGHRASKEYPAQLPRPPSPSTVIPSPRMSKKNTQRKLSSSSSTYTCSSIRYATISNPVPPAARQWGSREQGRTPFYCLA